MSLADAAAAAEMAWSMDEASGTRASSVGSHDLSDNNTVGSTTGMFDNAALFVAANSEWLERASGSDVTTGDEDVSWTCWFKSPSSLPGSNQMIFCRRAGNGVINYDLFYSQAQNKLIWTYGIVSVVSDVSISTDTWYFVSCGHDATNNLVFVRVNAGSRVTDSDSGFDVFLPITAAFRVGDDGFSQYLDGAVDDLVFMRDYVFTSGDHDDAYAGGAGVAFADWAGASPVTKLYTTSYRPRPFCPAMERTKFSVTGGPLN